jgi:hypothetical protein
MNKAEGIVIYFKDLFRSQAKNPPNLQDVKGTSSQRHEPLAKGATLCCAAQAPDLSCLLRQWHSIYESTP